MEWFWWWRHGWLGWWRYGRRGYWWGGSCRSGLDSDAHWAGFWLCVHVFLHWHTAVFKCKGHPLFWINGGIIHPLKVLRQTFCAFSVKNYQRNFKSKAELQITAPDFYQVTKPVPIFQLPPFSLTDPRCPQQRAYKHDILPPALYIPRDWPTSTFYWVTRQEYQRVELDDWLGGADNIWRAFQLSPQPMRA